MKVRFLGAHNIESRRTRMVSLLIDGILAVDAGGLTSSLSFRNQGKLKAVLLTHQHLDHVRDLPALAMNCFLRDASISVHSTRPVFNALRDSLFDGGLYPDFFEPRQGIQVIRPVVVEPYRPQRVEGYAVQAIPVVHTVPTVGYEIVDSRGQAVFYTGDTGPGLYESWRHVSPHLLVTEVTVSNRHGETAGVAGHLSPNLLKGELETFTRLKGYLPRVVAVHMNPHMEAEIVEELAIVARALDADITVAHEGMEIRLDNA